MSLSRPRFDVVVAALAALSASAPTAQAAPVTYDYTGTVIFAQGAYSQIARGTTVIGTYTFDFDNATEAGAIPVSAENGWFVESTGGPAVGLPVRPAVFSSTAWVGGVELYRSQDRVDFYSHSGLRSSGGLLGNEVVGFGYSDPISGEPIVSGYVTSSLTYSGALLASGLPMAIRVGEGAPRGNRSGSTGFFSDPMTVQSDGGLLFNSVYFEVSSLSPTSPVPAPSAAWLLVSGLALLARRCRDGRPGPALTT